MWNTLPEGPSTIDAERREMAFGKGDSPIVWRDMVDKGSNYARYTGAQDSSREIIQTLLSKHRAPPLKLRLELRGPRCALDDTSAGAILKAEVRLHEERLRRELQEEEEGVREMQAELEQSRRLAAPNRSGGNQEPRRDRRVQRGVLERVFPGRRSLFHSYAMVARLCYYKGKPALNRAVT
ncbi:hypothetical protein CC86DRAFT_382327 [Ophiobolus disseminans]|uniref:Uncharacterized protein n=1 Tax=Ophiobolus disseminans TaxID=1469910 RepID=A0A6A7A0M4_9PLEO|nr:hypothetical protein CC86DRAFT_382327 [Ophiobolus disseminans]